MTVHPELERTRHPLCPLTRQELEVAVAAVRADERCPAECSFRVVTLDEPARAAMRAFDRGGSPPPRRARVSLFDLAARQVNEIVVDLPRGGVCDWRTLDRGRQPGIQPPEQPRIRAAVLADPRWRAAMRRRGVEDLEAVALETGAGARFGSRWDGRARVGRTLTFLKPAGTRNHYAHPVQDLLCFVDLETFEVLEVVDGDHTGIPSEPAEFDVPPRGRRPPLKPLVIAQPEGVGFEVTDHGVLRWQNWSLRVSLHPIDGLVLHQVAYDDDGRRRSVLYRAGLAEMVVPYGDPAVNQYWRNAFDLGEAGVGHRVQSLELGCDCLGEIRYLDADIADPDGSVRTVERAICIHEEDWNIAWKHAYRGGPSVVRRSRRLVVSCWATMGNYDYGFFWYLDTEGNIEFEVKPTGILYTGGVSEDQATHRFGTVIGPGLYAPIHQHIFCVRLDPEVDGPENTVVQVDVRPEPAGPDNPHGSAFRAHEVPLERESAARSDVNAATARSWLIANRDVTNRVGAPVAFRLVPRATATMLAAPDAHVSELAPFARHNLWVTAYDPALRYPAGDYPAWGDHGLGDPRREDHDIVQTDIVLWHCFAATHVPRIEDWPCMPVEHVGFTLHPSGFFDANPALDLPEPQHGDACH